MSSSAFPFEPHKLLDDLGRITQQFKTWLDTEPEIDIMDQISIDNHLALLHLCFGAWKTKHGSTWKNQSSRDNNPHSVQILMLG